MPSRAKVRWVSGVSDSPILKPVCGSRSSRATRWPAAATSVAAVDPAGPPPITTTSKSSASRALSAFAAFSGSTLCISSLPGLASGEARHGPPRFDPGINREAAGGNDGGGAQSPCVGLRAEKVLEVEAPLERSQRQRKGRVGGGGARQGEGGVGGGELGRHGAAPGRPPPARGA